MKETNITPSSPAIGCKIGQAYQIMLGQLSGALKKEGLELTTSEYLILRAIYSRPGAQQCEIADMVGKDKAAVCRCIGGLQKKGLVMTKSISHKCLKVYPSDVGLELEPKILKVAALRHNDLLQLASQSEIETFTRILDNIIASK